MISFNTRKIRRSYKFFLILKLIATTIYLINFKFQLINLLMLININKYF